MFRTSGIESSCSAAGAQGAASPGCVGRPLGGHRLELLKGEKMKQVMQAMRYFFSSHVFLLVLTLFMAVGAEAQDHDLDNDGQWDYGRGGTDRDIDNDGQWDYDKGGTDRDLDNDIQWDLGAGGTDRDVDNDGQWDHDKGGTDRDLDNDGSWDENQGGTDHDSDNDGQWDE